MATELGKAYVQIVPSAKGIKGSIEDQLSPEGERSGRAAGDSAGSNFASTFKKVLVAAGVGTIIKNAINAGGELEQNLGGTEAVFGQFAGKIQDSAYEAYKNMGLSASDYMATANKMGSLFQGSGVEQERALSLTSDAMQRAADVASVMGLDTTAAMESIAGAAKGNFTMMDNLGVAMNATTLQAYALEQGINFDWNTADNAEKAELAMKMFMDRTTQYAGNFAKESTETFSGSLGAMKASFTDLLGALSTGQDIDVALSNLGGTIVTFFQNLLPMISDVVTQIPMVVANLLLEAGPQLIEAGMQALGGILDGFTFAIPRVIPMMVEAITTMITTILENLPMLIEAGLGMLVALVQGLLDAIPVLVEAIPQIIESLITTILEAIPLIIQAGIDLLVALVEALPQIIESIVVAIPQIIDGIISAVLDNIPLIVQAGIDLLVALVQNLPTIILTIVQAIPDIISAILDALIENLPLIIDAGVDLFVALIENLPTIILEIVKAVPDIIEGIVSAFGSLAWKIVEIGEDIVSGIWEGIQNLATWLWDKVSGFFTGIWDGIKGFFGISSPSKLMAELGEELPAGMAVGILGNLKPVSKAMDEMGELANRSYAADLAFNATTSNSMRGLDAALASGVVGAGVDTVKQPAHFQLVMGNHVWDAFVDDITSTQDRKVELVMAY